MMSASPSAEYELLKRWILELVQPLDESSRYIRELDERLRRALDADALERAWEGCRGELHAGVDAFVRMGVREKLLANLVTSESRYFRFEQDELSWIEQRFAASAPELQQVLVAPCALGEEAFSLAATGLSLRARVQVLGVDVQPALLSVAAETRDGARPVPASIRERTAFDELREAVRFLALDLLQDDWGALEPAEFDWVSCRNFLGYLKPAHAAACAERLWARVRPGGALLLDAFCLQKLPVLRTTLRALGAQPLAPLPFFLRPARP